MSDDAHDIGAEQSLLGSALMAPDAAGAALLAVPEGAWWQPKHATIAAVIGGRLRRGAPVDPQLVLTDLLSRQGFGSESGPYLITLVQRAWAPTNAPDYADRVLHCAARRNLAAAATRLRQRLDEAWVNGYAEPVSTFTAELREAIDASEQADAGLASDEPSLTLTQLLAGKDDHDWLVPGLLERGERIIITGSEGLGKSWMISQFAACLAAGRHPFTGMVLGSGAKQLRVLVVDCENGMSQSRRRFRTIASRIGDRDRSWLDNLRIELRPNGLNLLGSDASWLERKIALNAPDLVVVGPLYRLHYANMNDETAARDLVRVLDQLRTRYGCALLSEAHPGHAEDGAGERRMRPAGSSLFLRWPEFGFGLRRAKNAAGEHPSLVDVVAWRGSREERAWPRQLKHGNHLPWEPANQDYYEEAA
jgi:AAA domain-containing protein/DnaB helicase-like protein